MMSPAISSSENEIFISMKFTHSYHTLSKLFIESRMSFGFVLFEGGPGSEKWPLKQACREISQRLNLLNLNLNLQIFGKNL